MNFFFLKEGNCSNKKWKEKRKNSKKEAAKKSSSNVRNMQNLRQSRLSWFAFGSPNCWCCGGWDGWMQRQREGTEKCKNEQDKTIEPRRKIYAKNNLVFCGTEQVKGRDDRLLLCKLWVKVEWGWDAGWWNEVGCGLPWSVSMSGLLF